MNAAVKPETRNDNSRRNPARVAGAIVDAIILVAVLLFSAIAISVIALGAPLVLGVSAIAGAVAPKRMRGRWREAHAA